MRASNPFHGYGAELFTGGAFVVLIVFGALGLGGDRPAPPQIAAEARSRSENVCVRKLLQQRVDHAEARATCRSLAGP